MNVSQNGIDLIKRFEGCSLTAYKCPAGVWTIGYGHTKDVKQGDKITQAKAEEFLKNDLKVYEAKVRSIVKISLTQNQFDALVSFCYNCGPANLKKLVSNRNAAQIGNAILLYNKAGGRILNGLVKRRNAEKELFLKK